MAATQDTKVEVPLELTAEVKKTIPVEIVFRQVISKVSGISGLEKTILIDRYTSLIHQYRRRATMYSYIYNLLRFIVTVGSLIVPALLSIQYNSTTPVDVNTAIYWSTWTLSLLVTTSNGVITLYKVDKKYYMLNTVFEQVKSEGYQYLELSGKYGGKKTPKEKPTYTNQYPFFCTALEKITMKQVEEEYFKMKDTDKSSESATAAQTEEQKSLVPPTPEFLEHILKSKKDGSSPAGAPPSKLFSIQESEEENDSTEIQDDSKTQPLLSNSFQED